MSRLTRSTRLCCDFVSDGTPVGTRLVRDVFPGNCSFDPAPTRMGVDLFPS